MVTLDRSNRYYERRLKAEHPSIYADWRDGKIPTFRQALIASGLKKPRSQLGILNAAWAKALPSERRQFLALISGTAVRSPAVTPKAKAGSKVPGPARQIAVGTRVTGLDGRLLKGARDRVHDVMAARQVGMGTVMAEMGFKKRNPALGLALRPYQPATVSQDLAAALEKWLDDNKSV